MSAWRFSARRGAARLCRALMASPRPGLRILTYHRVNDDHPHDRLSVSQAAFRAQMRELRRSGRPVLRLRDAVGLLIAGGMPEGALAITLDDGYADNYEVALPALREHALPATVFVATGYTGSSRTIERYRSCCTRDRMLDWDEVRELQRNGVAIGGHGRSHCELAGLQAREVAAEVEGCAQDIAERLGARPVEFCYPRGSTDAAVRRAVAEAGFESACTVRPGANPAGSDLLALRRTEISGADSLEDFRFKLDGGFDAWHRLVQASRRRGHR